MKRSILGLKVVAFAACVFLNALPSNAMEKIVLGTDWRAEAEHGGYYQALAEGFYAAAGLEVTIRQGGPQVNHAQLLAAGKIDFSISPSSFVLLNFVAQNIPAVAVAAIFQKDPAVLISHAGQGNDSLADLKGKKIMISPDTRVGYWRYLKAKYGYTDDQIAPYTFNLAPFLSNPQSIQQGYVTSEPYQITRAGQEPVVMLLADSGYTSYASVITTSSSLVRSHPDVVQRFVDASIKGWISYLNGNAALADALIRRDNPDMTNELLKYGRSKLKDYGVVDSGDAKATGIGTMNDSRWKAFFEVMAADGLYAKDMDYRRAFTLEFIKSRPVLQSATSAEKNP